MKQESIQYTLKRMLNTVPRDQYSPKFTALAKAMGVHTVTLYRYMNATWEKPVNIPTDRLIKAAAFWECSIDDLINQPANTPS